MSLKSKEIKAMDINFDDEDRADSRNSSRNSMGDEINSHYSYTDSDLHDFQKMERDIYGSHGDDESSQEHDIMHEYLEEVTDEQTESLEFVRPHVPVRPSLGNPIDTYDQLRTHYEPINHFQQATEIVENHVPIKTKTKENLNHNTTSPIHKSRGSSRGSGGSMETVLSKNQQMDELPSIVIIAEKPTKSRQPLSSISSAESLEKQSKKRVNNRAKLKDLLDKEKATRKSQETYIEHLQQSLNQVLSQHALAKETIDQLRLGITLNIDETHTRPRLRRERHHKRPSTASNSQIIPRRFSSIVGNGEIPEYMGRSNITSRARSVDMNIFDEEVPNKNTEQHQTGNDFGGSLKYVKNDSFTNQGLSREIANDFQQNFDKFQTRIEIIEQAIEELSMYIDGGASGSSGSQYGDLDGTHDRHQADTENRLQNILLAYENLRKDFTQVSQVWKDTAKNYMPANKVMHNMDSTEQIEGSLFQLRMQLDDLERHVNQSRQPSLTTHAAVPIRNHDRNLDLVKRLATLEDKYRQLMGRYHDLKRLSSPSTQKDLDDIVHQLQNVVVEANGRSTIIATPEIFENMLHEDLIDSMKRHLSSDSPPYFLTEDGQSSTNSSFGKRRSNTKKGKYRTEWHRSDEDSDWKHPDERISPTKSHSSPRSIDIKGKHSPTNQTRQSNSQPVSAVSSTSGFQGATSGETLLVDDRGVFKEPFPPSPLSTNGVFSRLPNKVEIPLKSRNFTKSLDLESPRSKPNSTGMQNLDDDVKRLDEHLARIELEEKNRSSEHIANRDSDVPASRNTRSLLGSSPSNSNYSGKSKHTSSVGSGHKSCRTRQSKHEDHNHNDNRKKPRSYKWPIESTDSGEESASYDDDDLEDYVKHASCGIGPRSRYVRKKSNNVQDRWSQTPLRNSHKIPRPGAYNGHLSPEYDNPYIDDVAYWDGVAFHPAREGLPGKSILRQSSPHSNRRRRHSFKNSPQIRPYSGDSFSRPSFPTHSRIPYPLDPSLREYSTLGPHRYFVREYGQLNRIPQDHSLMYDDYEDDVGDDYSYRKNIEERRMYNYLDEAIRAARDIKQYTRRLSNICEQRHFGRSDIGSYPYRDSRPLYT